MRLRAGYLHLADALVEASKAAADARVHSDNLLARERLSKALRPAQIEYLRGVSPAAADAWEAGRQVA